jgi:DNA-binding ferritin-like protein
MTQSRGPLTSQSSSGLITALRLFHSDNFVAYFKTHYYHFAVQGSTFSQDHALLNDIYDFLWNAHDDIGEQLRQQDALPFSSMAAMIDASCLSEAKSGGVSSSNMFEDLSKVIDILIDAAQNIYDQTDPHGGLQTFIGDYLKDLSKLHWKVKATIGKSIK